MKRLPNAGMIKRDLSFPVVFQGKTITASPGDTLGSAILLNDKENLVPNYFFSDINTSDLAVEDEGSYLGLNKDALVYLDPFFQRELYPGFKFHFGKLDPVRGEFHDYFGNVIAGNFELNYGTVPPGDQVASIGSERVIPFPNLSLIHI